MTKGNLGLFSLNENWYNSQRRFVMSKQELETRYQKIQEKVFIYKKQSNFYALIRFLLCFVIVADLLVGYFQKKPYLYIISLISLIIFLILIHFHQRVKEQYIIASKKCEVYERHLLRREGKWLQFDDGKEFINENDFLSSDLDIFGHHSLYQFINICFTKRGKEKLATCLSTQSLSLDEMTRRQEAVRELSSMHDFVYDIETFGSFIQDISNKELKNIQYSKSTFSIFSLILPLMTIISLVFMIFHLFLPYSSIVFEIGLVSQIILTFLYYSKHQTLFEPIAHFHKSLSHYVQVFDLIQKQNFQSSFLINIQNQLIHDTVATKVIDQLSRIAVYVGYRQNIFVFILFNALFSYDIFCAYFYQKWIDNYGDKLEAWLDALADLEACMSLSVVKIDDFDVCLPHIVNDFDLSFDNLRHPLIDPAKVIGNDWYLQKNMNVITGSNMSGKTTFMRSIALNLILSYAGGFVFASDMICSPMSIYTSMRVKDNVGEGISTFYGELMRIKMMIEASIKQKPMICFIDEIFKGTNSLDRIAGAKATIEKLSLPYCLTFITTHDFELCSSTQMKVQNYHFDEYYENNHIYFPYIIKDGQSHSTNGQFLLKQLGIMEE